MTTSESLDVALKAIEFQRAMIAATQSTHQELSDELHAAACELRKLRDIVGQLDNLHLFPMHLRHSQ